MPAIQADPTMSIFDFGYICSSLELVLYGLAHGAERAENVAPRLVKSKPQTAYGAPKLLLPLDRWKVGHRFFFVLIQGLITEHARLESALRDENWDEVELRLRTSTQLWWASSIALRFSSTFSREDYESIVRPAMMPPHVSSGFSGLHSADHRVLLAYLRGSRKGLVSLPQRARASHGQYLWALSHTYQEHIRVCEKFVDEHGTSLVAEKMGREEPGVKILRERMAPRTIMFAGAIGSNIEDEQFEGKSGTCP
jgi:hypothetical protein